LGGFNGATTDQLEARIKAEFDRIKPREWQELSDTQIHNLVAGIYMDYVVDNALSYVKNTYPAISAALRAKNGGVDMKEQDRFEAWYRNEYLCEPSMNNDARDRTLYAVWPHHYCNLSAPPFIMMNQYIPRFILCHHHSFGGGGSGIQWVG